MLSMGFIDWTMGEQL